MVGGREGGRVRVCVRVCVCVCVCVVLAPSFQHYGISVVAGKILKFALLG